jgi:hypothetical protein
MRRNTRICGEIPGYAEHNLLLPLLAHIMLQHRAWLEIEIESGGFTISHSRHFRMTSPSVGYRARDSVFARNIKSMSGWSSRVGAGTSHLGDSMCAEALAWDGQEWSNHRCRWGLFVGVIRSHRIILTLADSINRILDLCLPTLNEFQLLLITR